MNLASRLRSLLDRPRRLGQGGAAAIELAIVAPFLAIVLVGVAELSFAIRERLQVQESAAAGALYAAENGWDSAGISSAVTSADNGAGITATPAPTMFCGCPSASSISPATCGRTCPDTLLARTYVQVNASMTRTTILPSTLPLPAVLTAAVTTRIQ